MDCYLYKKQIDRTSVCLEGENRAKNDKKKVGGNLFGMRRLAAEFLHPILLFKWIFLAKFCGNNKRNFF